MSYEPLVTISLKEYNSLLVYRDDAYRKFNEICDTKFRFGIQAPWKDIIDEHKISFNGQIYTYTKSISKDGQTAGDELNIKP